MPEKIYQHYVPKFYLKGFTFNSGESSIYVKERGTLDEPNTVWEHRNIKKVGGKEFYYRFLNSQGISTDEFEDFLSQYVENKKIAASVRKRSGLCDYDYENIMLFMSYQFFRVPTQRNNFVKYYNLMFKLSYFLSHFYRLDRQSVDFLKNHNVKFGEDVKYIAYQADMFIKQLLVLEMTPEIYTFNDPVFITGDNAIITDNDFKSKKLKSLYFPLTSNTLIIWSTDHNSYEHLTTRDVNTWIALNSKLIFGSSKDLLIQADNDAKEYEILMKNDWFEYIKIAFQATFIYVKYFVFNCDYMTAEEKKKTKNCQE